ncbi:MAG: phosphoribosyltransferase domain-containing protein [Nitrososphaerota archaeon]|nr:phosphoribosyltransferase domain-containing protein [Nitrososphaerota archaeon]MDG6939337.1 phosphoribosyltransferase domain-containing protein [Nitrososphaerota archaeon]
MILLSPADEEKPHLKQVIGWEEFGALAEGLVAKIKADGGAFDLVVGIARGGVPLSMVVADRLKVPLDFINVKSYVGEDARGEVRILSTLLEDARGKSVLLVDDLVDEGETMTKLAKFLGEKYDLAGLKTAALYVKPWSGFRPDYSVGTTEAWVVFPWEHGEFLSK